MANNNVDLNTVMEKYTSDIAFIGYYKIFSEQLKTPKLLARFVRAGAAIHLSTLEKTETDYIFLLASMAAYLMQDFTDKERREFTKAVLGNPKLHQDLLQLMKDLNEVKKDIKSMNKEIKEWCEEAKRFPEWFRDLKRMAKEERWSEKMRESGRKASS